ncbi:hypothetical protein E8E12_011594 [Didymella heteroderae]|uniref:Uncharacterized protein n=1 Tax=Didymella heteroderae TaxID=1769908 RepID=A0A9P5C785_9PLEO|nr:hypothetical protein E8E12_011594 [Didymella heteroderae]
MAFEFLAPILTPTALRSVQADARPLLTLLLVIIGLSLFVAKVEKKGGFLGFGKK